MVGIAVVQGADTAVVVAPEEEEVHVRGDKPPGVVVAGNEPTVEADLSVAEVALTEFEQKTQPVVVVDQEDYIEQDHPLDQLM